MAQIHTRSQNGGSGKSANEQIRARSRANAKKAANLRALGMPAPSPYSQGASSVRSHYLEQNERETGPRRGAEARTADYWLSRKPKATKAAGKKAAKRKRKDPNQGLYRHNKKGH